MRAFLHPAERRVDRRLVAAKQSRMPQDRQVTSDERHTHAHAAMMMMMMMMMMREILIAENCIKMNFEAEVTCCSSVHGLLTIDAR